MPDHRMKKKVWVDANLGFHFKVVFKAKMYKILKNDKKIS